MSLVFNALCHRTSVSRDCWTRRSFYNVHTLHYHIYIYISLIDPREIYLRIYIYIYIHWSIRSIDVYICPWVVSRVCVCVWPRRLTSSWMSSQARRCVAHFSSKTRRLSSDASSSCRSRAWTLSAFNAPASVFFQTCSRSLDKNIMTPRCQSTIAICVSLDRDGDRFSNTSHLPTPLE